MKTTVEDINDTRKVVTVDVPVTVVAETEKELLGEFARQARLPGFRPGKAPEHLIRAKFKKEIAEELNRKLTSKAYDQGVKEAKLEVFSIVSVDGGEFKSGEAGQVKFTLDIQPKFDLPEYKGVEVVLPKAEVKDEEVEQAWNYILSQRAEYNVVDKAAEKGDFVKLSYEGKVDGQLISEIAPDAPIYGTQATTWEEAGAENAPGVRAIIDGIVGMKAGDKKEVEQVFGDDFEVEALRGKKAVYSIEVKEVREKKLPEVNEEFLSSMNCKTEEELREQIRKDILNNRERELENIKRQQILDKIAAQVSFPLPESALESETQLILADYMRREMSRGKSEEEFEKQKEDLYAQASSAASNRLKLEIILAEIARKEKIELQEQDIQRAVIQEAMRLRVSPDDLVKELRKNRTYLNNLRRNALFGKVVDLLSKEAKVTEGELPSPAGSPA